VRSRVTALETSEVEVFGLVAMLSCKGEFGVFVERISMLPYRKGACHGSQLPQPQLTFWLLPLPSFFVHFFVFFFHFTVFIFLYLGTGNRKGGEKFIPDSLLMLCVSLKRVSYCSIVIANRHEHAGLLPGCTRHWHYYHEVRGSSF
jgi:hypothetical protein